MADGSSADFSAARTERKTIRANLDLQVMVVWTPAIEADLARLWDEGKTAAQIGAALGISRNAVIGKARRMELKPRPSPIKRALLTLEERREREVVRKRRAYVAQRQANGMVVGPPRDKKLVVPVTDRPISATAKCQFIEIERPPGRWQESDKCLQPALVDSAFCPHHHARCYIPHKPKAEAT